jgi:hypothetical protein
LKNIAIFLKCSSLGDTISSIPAIKFLYNIYKKNITVYAYNTDVLKNYPYININKMDDSKFISLRNNPDWLVFSTFDTSTDLHPRIDIRQFHASKLGIQLLPEEMNIEFYPDTYEPIENLPKNYIVIHPAKTWPSRTWEKDRWQKFTTQMNNNNISIVSVGKESSESGTFNTKKPTYNIQINNGIDLINKLSIHQTWHILNKATVVITSDSGILHLAGTTNTAILQLGSSIDPRLRAPYRNNTQDYKYKYVSGDCKLLCASNPSYYAKFNGDFNKIGPIPFCLERSESIGVQDVDPEIYKCHPSVDDVFDSSLTLYNKYKEIENIKPKNVILTSNKGKIITY